LIKYLTNALDQDVAKARVNATAKGQQTLIGKLHEPLGKEARLTRLEIPAEMLKAESGYEWGCADLGTVPASYEEHIKRLSTALNEDTKIADRLEDFARDDPSKWIHNALCNFLNEHRMRLGGKPPHTFGIEQPKEFPGNVVFFLFKARAAKKNSAQVGGKATSDSSNFLESLMKVRDDLENDAKFLIGDADNADAVAVCLATLDEELPRFEKFLEQFAIERNDTDEAMKLRICAGYLKEMRKSNTTMRAAFETKRYVDLPADDHKLNVYAKWFVETAAQAKLAWTYQLINEHGHKAHNGNYRKVLDDIGRSLTAVLRVLMRDRRFAKSIQPKLVEALQENLIPAKDKASPQRTAFSHLLAANRLFNQKDDHGVFGLRLLAAEAVRLSAYFAGIHHKGGNKIEQKAVLAGLRLAFGKVGDEKDGLDKAIATASDIHKWVLGSADKLGKLWTGEFVDGMFANKETAAVAKQLGKLKHFADSLGFALAVAKAVDDPTIKNLYSLSAKSLGVIETATKFIKDPGPGPAIQAFGRQLGFAKNAVGKVNFVLAGIDVIDGIREGDEIKAGKGGVSAVGAVAAMVGANTPLVNVVILGALVVLQILDLLAGDDYKPGAWMKHCFTNMALKFSELERVRTNRWRKAMDSPPGSHNGYAHKWGKPEEELQEEDPLTVLSVLGQADWSAWNPPKSGSMDPLVKLLMDCGYNRGPRGTTSPIEAQRLLRDPRGATHMSTKAIRERAKRNSKNLDKMSDFGR